MAQYTIDLPCIADTYIDKENPNVSFGSSTTLRGWEKYSDWGFINSFILLKYDFSSLPQRKKIIKIVSRFYNVSTLTLPSSGYSDFGFHYLEEDWSESTTWNTAGPRTKDSGGGLVPITQNIPANQYYELVLHSIVIERLREYGLRLLFKKTEGGQITYEPMVIQSREGANPPILRITYEDAPPNPPTPIEPIGSYEDSKATIHFEWEYNSDVGGEQKAFDLQYSTDQVNWSAISETTSNNYYDLPADTLPGGNIYWRVRCYNEYDEVSDYSSPQSFYAVGAPETPAISSMSTETSRPIISWSAFRQQTFQLQILQGDGIVYDTGNQPSINTRQHKVTAFLNDGEHTARLRIKNEYDLWSAWGEATFTVATVKPDKPALAIQTSAYGIELNFSTSPTDGYTLIYRSEYNKSNYICIGKTTAATYQDNAVCNNAEYKYFVRAVAADETYEDSDIKFIQANFRHSLIAPVTDLTNVFVFSRSLNSPPKRVYNRNINSASVYYAGRMYLVDEPTEHIAAGMSFTYFLKTWADAERFLEIYDLKGVVLYRDAKGRKIYGSLSNLAVTDEHCGYTISFVISQTDYNESVEV